MKFQLGIEIQTRRNYIKSMQTNKIFLVIKNKNEAKIIDKVFNNFSFMKPWSFFFSFL